MKNGNYNKMGKIGKKKIAIFAIFLIVVVLAVTEKIPSKCYSALVRDNRFGDVCKRQLACQIPELFITLLLKLPPRKVGVDSNPCTVWCRADNTQNQELTFFSSAPMLFSTPAAGLPPAGLQVDSNQLTRAADNIPRKEAKKAGGLALRKDAMNRPPKFHGWLDELIEKIWQVEASGRLNPPDGDGGRAAGPLQIHQGALDDVNKRYGTKFCREDLRNLKTAKLIARLYISRWMERHKEEIAARIFNGGPRGWRKKSTDEYWEDIQGVK